MLPASGLEEHAMHSVELPEAYDAALRSGRWRFLSVLGSGGLAVVYLVEDMRGALGKVALKVSFLIITKASLICHFYYILLHSITKYY